MAIAFSDYLLGQRGRSDAVGELSRDAGRDPEWPKQRGLSLSHLRNYLLANRASQSTLEALERAWNEYAEINRSDRHLAGELDDAARQDVAVPTRPLYRDEASEA